jgi:hypothetical protein
MISQILKVFCRSCNREGPARIVNGHTDGRDITSCSLCNSIDVRPVEVNASRGRIFDRMKITSRKAEGTHA